MERLIAKYYISARNLYGINNSNLTNDDFYCLKGIGVYPPLNSDFLKENIQNTILANGYIIIYFHSISTLGSMANSTFIPLSFFQNHLDDVVELSDDLWIAGQSDVIKYVRIRQNSNFLVNYSQSQITCFLKSNLDRNVYDIPITIKLNLPQIWKKKKIVKYYSSIKPFSVFTNVDSVLSLDVPINEQIFLRAY